jgi:hypothetical protein
LARPAAAGQGRGRENEESEIGPATSGHGTFGFRERRARHTGCAPRSRNR